MPNYVFFGFDAGLTTVPHRHSRNTGCIEFNRLPVPSAATCPLYRNEPEHWTTARELHP